MSNDDQLCIFCSARPATTRDHVPPKNLFPTPRPSNLITVPTCDICNLGSSNDDEYFRLMIVMRDDAHQHPGAKQAWQTAYRGLKRETKKGLAARLLGDIQQAEAYTESGTYVGHRSIFKIDYPRVETILIKTVRGLFWFVTGRPLPESHEVRAYVLEAFDDQFWSDEKLTRWVQIGIAQEPHIIGDNIFSYRYKFSVDDEHTSIWVMEFYGYYPVIAFTVPKNTHNKPINRTRGADAPLAG